jgi:hypothetical protein
MVQLGSVSLSGILVIRQQWLPAELGIRVIRGCNGQLIVIYQDLPCWCHKVFSVALQCNNWSTQVASYLLGGAWVCQWVSLGLPIYKSWNCLVEYKGPGNVFCGLQLIGSNR